MKYWKKFLTLAFPSLTPRKPAGVAIVATGKPSKCMFCEARPDVAVANGGKQAFVCSEHLGSFVVDWTTAPELTVIRL